MSLNGTWTYQSFRPDNGNPSLRPWAPPAQLSVTTDEAGKVSGKLTFPSVPGLELAISGSVMAAVPGKLPPRVELTGEGGRSSVNMIQGYFVTGSPSPLITGTVIAVRSDPAGQPDGTSGPFVLFQLTQ
jgi:hypothetical protein